MPRKLNLENILFLDIETVPKFKDFGQLEEIDRELWEQKTRFQRKEDQTAEEFYERAGIYAEFGKIICISVGFFTFEQGKRSFRIRSYYGEEKELLLNFKNLLDRYFYKSRNLLCAHNGKELDFPYLARRMIINQISLPSKLDMFGKRPWEVPHLDTLELWRFGDYKNYNSLELMSRILGIPSPKDDIKGSEVYRVYYEENNISRIVKYCEKDTVTVAQIFLRLRNEPLLTDDEIIIVDN